MLPEESTASALETLPIEGAILGSWRGMKYLPPAALRCILATLPLARDLWLLASRWLLFGT
jgi:hypothetical protein